MLRSEAREKVFQTVFQIEFHDDFADRYEFLLSELELKGVQGEYARETVKGILENLSAIDTTIRANLKNWTFERLSKQTVAVLRLGVYELLFTDSIPDVTAIDEAVKIAYQYCDDKEAVFINGILNKLYEDKKAKL